MATILLTADRVGLRESLAALLTARQHRVVEAGDLPEALAALRRERADLVVAHVDGPDAGCEVIRAIRSEAGAAATPMLLCSATAVAPEIARIVEACGVRMLGGPAEPGAVADAVAAVLDAAARAGGARSLDHAGGKPRLSDALDTKEQLELAIRGSHTGLWVYDIPAGQLSMSPECKALLGFAETELEDSYDAWFERLHPDDRERVIANRDGFLAGGTETYDAEYRLRHKDGSYRWILSRAVCKRDAEGRAVRLAGSHIDITRLKAAEAEATDRARHAKFVAAVAEALSGGGTLREMLGRCAAAMVEHLDAALGRIWTVNAVEPVLELQASEGLKTRVDGPYARVPISQFKAGRVTRDMRPLVSNQVVGHPEMPDQDWLKRERLTSFAGYPLVLEDRLLGVIAMFARQPISGAVIEALASVAHAIAIGIERRRSEQSRKRLVELLDAATDFITIGLPEGPPFYMNRAAREAFGLGPDESIDSLFAVRAPEFQDYFNRVILPAVERDGAWSGETTYVVNGRRIPVSQVTVGHKNAEGAIEFFSTISRDISTQKEAEAILRRATDALIEAEERTRFALDAARTGVWEADLETGQVTWSETMHQICGVLPGAFDGSTAGLLALVHRDDREIMARILQPHAECPDNFEFETRVVWPDGSTHWMQTRGQIVCNEAGQATRLLAVAQDVTERKELEGQLRQAQKIEAVGQLAGGLAHDFNNLLTVILGFSRLVEEQLNPADPQRANVEEVIRAGERASRLTQQLLAFSRKQMLQPVILDLNELLESNSRMLSRLVGEQIDLTLGLKPGRATITADPGQIEQILVNLVVNARDAMEAGGTLTLSTARTEIGELYARSYLGVEPGPYVVLGVADTGIGMDEDTRQRIFEPFFTTKERGKGTGMGLATVFGIVKQSGGFIKVSSERGRGTTFRIFFPAASVEAKPARPDAVSPTPAGGSETILLVEDEDSVRALVRAVLERKGYTVVAAADPEDAIRIAGTEAQRIDLLLTDVMMPGLTGDALFRRLRATTRSNLRVLYMSGYADEAIVGHGILEPGTPFLHKPFTGSVLARKVRDVLDQPA